MRLPDNLVIWAQESQPDPPEVQLRQQMESAGIEPPASIVIDGNLHRFATGPTGKDDAGWYVVYPDGVPAGKFGDWRTGTELNFRADIGRQLSAAEEMAIIRRMSEAKARRDEAKDRERRIAAGVVDTIWSDCTPASKDHPYLSRKGIGPNGARVTGDGRLVVPLTDTNEKNSVVLHSLQYISEDGKKLYHAGGKTGGMYWLIGDSSSEKTDTIYIAEGFATGATILEEVGQAVAIAYSAGNIEPVTGKIRALYPTKKIVIVADNDASQVGQRYAEQAAAKHGAIVVVPPIAGDANDYRAAGNNLKELLCPKMDAFFVSADEWAQEPKPVAWLVKGWLQKNSMMMVHGPSGSGKTFQVLDWCLRLSSGAGDWLGHTVKQAPVLYLAGEGHHGLRGRIAAWKQHNGVKHVGPMWLSKGGMDINLPGPLQTIIQQIRLLPEVPSLIVVDTLHRFLSGDENSAQDAKTMLDACSVLMREFSCAVLLVHHTGVSDEAQHRARGSSAWRGALDIEISIRPNGEKSFKITQMKSKDADEKEAVICELRSVMIDGWHDEDGALVGSAVAVRGEEEGETIDRKEHEYTSRFQKAWEFSGKEHLGEMPYISRAAWTRYIIEVEGKTKDTAKKELNPRLGRMAGKLIEKEVISQAEHGFVMVSNLLSSINNLIGGEANG